MEGWVKLHRKFIEWEWYQDANMVKLFLHLLLTANHEDRSWRGIDIKRGQMITGRKSLSESVGMSEQTLRTCLDRLKSTNEITIKATNRYSILTVCNYDTYQSKKEDVNQQSNQQPTNNQPTTNQQVTTNKKVKKVKNEKNIPSFNLFKQYAIEKKPNIDTHALKLKYEAWVINDWKDGNGNTIKNWKVKLLNTIPYLNETKAGESKGTNLSGDELPESYGVRSKTAITREQFKKEQER